MIRIKYVVQSKNFADQTYSDIVTLEQLEKGYINEIYIQQGIKILSRELLLDNITFKEDSK